MRRLDVFLYRTENSWDEDGQISSFTWDFGDGGSGTGATIDHTFPAAGTYSVTLTVVDNEGHEGTMTLPVPVVIPPVAVITVSCSGLTCTFDGSGSSDPDGTIVDYTWFFGDGVRHPDPSSVTPMRRGTFTRSGFASRTTAARSASVSPGDRQRAAACGRS